MLQLFCSFPLFSVNFSALVFTVFIIRTLRLPLQRNVMGTYSLEAFSGPGGPSNSYKSLDLLRSWGVGANFRNVNLHFLCSQQTEPRKCLFILQIILAAETQTSPGFCSRGFTFLHIAVGSGSILEV